MNISTTSGHLTSTEKRHIRAILEAGLTQAKVNRKTYYIVKNESDYTVTIIQNETGFLSGKIEPKKHTCKFVAA